MPEGIVGRLKVLVTGDVSGLKNDLKGLGPAAVSALGGITPLRNELRQVGFHVNQAGVASKAASGQVKSVGPAAAAAAARVAILRKEAEALGKVRPAGITNLRSQMQNLGSAAAALGVSLKQVGRQLTVGITLPVALLGRRFLKAASDAEEVEQRFEAVFKGLTADTAEWAAELGKATGRASTPLKALLARLQDTFVPLGFARELAADFSKELVKLAVDVASFQNVTDEQVLRDFQSALIGNSLAVQKYGIILRSNALNAELLELGIKGGTRAATEAQKAQARLSLIMKGSRDAVGTAAREIENYAGLLRVAQAAVVDLSEAFGRDLLPLAKDVVRSFTDVNEFLTELDPGLRNLATAAAIVAAALGPIALILAPIISASALLITATGGIGVAFLVAGAAAAAFATKLVRQALITSQAKEELRELVEELEKVDGAVAGTAIPILKLKELKQLEDIEEAQQALNEAKAKGRRLDALGVGGSGNALAIEEATRALEDAEKAADATTQQIDALIRATVRVPDEPLEDFTNSIALTRGNLRLLIEQMDSLIQKEAGLSIDLGIAEQIGEAKAIATLTGQLGEAQQQLQITKGLVDSVAASLRGIAPSGRIFAPTIDSLEAITERVEDLRAEAGVVQFEIDAGASGATLAVLEARLADVNFQLEEARLSAVATANAIALGGNVTVDTSELDGLQSTLGSLRQEAAELRESFRLQPAGGTGSTLLAEHRATLETLQVEIRQAELAIRALGGDIPATDLEFFEARLADTEALAINLRRQLRDVELGSEEESRLLSELEAAESQAERTLSVIENIRRELERPGQGAQREVRFTRRITTLASGDPIPGLDKVKDEVTDLSDIGVAGFRAIAREADGATRAGINLFSAILEGGAAGIVSGVVGLVGGLFSGPTAAERRSLAIRRENNAQLDRLTRGIARLGESLLRESSSVLTGLRDGLNDVQAGLDDIDGIADFATIPDRFTAVLEDLGITFEDAQRIAAGFDLELDGTLESWKAFTDALNTNFLEQLVKDFGVSTDLLRQEFDLLDVDNPLDQLARLQEHLSQFLRGDLAEAFAAVDFTGSGPDEFIQGVLDALRAGDLDFLAQLGDIDPSAFIDFLLDLERLGDAAGESADALSGLSNVPTGFKLAFRRFQADAGEVIDALPAPVPPGTSDPFNPQGPDFGPGGGGNLPNDELFLKALTDIDLDVDPIADQIDRLTQVLDQRLGVTVANSGTLAAAGSAGAGTSTAINLTFSPGSVVVGGTNGGAPTPELADAVEDAIELAVARGSRRLVARAAAAQR